MIPGIVASQASNEPEDEDTGGGPGTATFSDVVFLSSFDGTDGATSATDDSNSAHAITFNGTAQIDTAQFKFGTASLLLDGSGYVTVADTPADFQFGAGEFCVEAFVRLTNTTQVAATILSVLNVGSQESWRLMFSEDELFFQCSAVATGALATPIQITSGMSANTQHHVCVERDADNVLRLYVDGVMIDSAIVTTTLYAATVALGIGANSDGNNPLLGHVDEVRITKGGTWYADDAGFTPPAAPFPRS